MAVDYNKPDGTETSKVTFKTYLVDNIKASVQMLHTTGSNIPTDTIRRGVVTGSTYKWQNYNGSTWDDLTFRGSFDEITVTGTNTVRATFSNSGVGASYNYFKNSDTTNGTYIGINASEEAVFHNMENKAMHFGTNNINRLTLSSAGDLSVLGGILTITDSVSEKLALVQSDSAASYLAIKNSTATTGFKVGIDASEIAILNNTQNTAMSFLTNNTERMTIGAGGDVTLATGNSFKTPSYFEATSYGGGLIGKHSATLFQNVFSANSTYAPALDGSILDEHYGLAYTHSSNTSNEAKTGLGHQLLVNSNGITQTAIGSGIWTSGKLQVGTTTSTKAFPALSVDADDIIIGNGSGHRGMSIYSGSTSKGCLYFADGVSGTEAYRGYVQYDHNIDSLLIATSGTQRLTIDSYINPKADLLTDRWLTSDTNTIIGRDAAGSGNLAHSAGDEGWYNSFYGYKSGEDITSGYENSLFGSESGAGLTTGSSNCFFGTYSGRIYNSNSNTCMGYYSGEYISGNNNTCIGKAAGRATGADHAVFIGDTAGQYQDGDYSIGIGYFALQNWSGGTSGEGSIGIGRYAGQNVQGNYNIGIGHEALRGDYTSRLTGLGNIGIGTSTGYSITTGFHNVMIGNGDDASNYPGYNITTGYFNVLLGLGAGNDLTTGYGNTFLGAGAGTTCTTYNSCTCIGLGSDTLTGNNQMLFGNTSTSLYAYNTTINARSDKRDKTDITDTDLGLEFIMNLRPTKHRWDLREDYRTKYAEENKDKKDYVRKGINDFTPDGSLKKKRYHQSFIAQEVKATMNKLGVDFAGFQDHSINGGDDVFTLCYGEFIPPIVKAVQENNTLIGINTSSISDMQKQIDFLKAEIQTLKSVSK